MVYFNLLNLFFIHFIISFALCFLLLLIVYFNAKPKPNKEKNSPYECGFKPFQFTYTYFDVHFYRVGILFLLFDVEILFFFPWALNFYNCGFSGHMMMATFIIILVTGFAIEISLGALSWDIE